MGPSVLVTNDTAAAVTYTLNLSGLSTSSVNATVTTPPSAARDVRTVGNPAKPDATALSALIAESTVERRDGLGVTGAKFK